MGVFSIPYKETLDIGLEAVKTRPEGGTFLDKHSWNINFPNLTRKLVQMDLEQKAHDSSTIIRDQKKGKKIAKSAINLDSHSS